MPRFVRKISRKTRGIHTRTVNDGTVKVYHYDDLDKLRTGVLAFVTNFNFAKQLEALDWQIPYHVIC